MRFLVADRQRGKSAERNCLETTCVFASVLIQGRCEVAEEKDNEERKQKSLQRDSRCRSESKLCNKRLERVRKG